MATRQVQAAIDSSAPPQEVAKAAVQDAVAAAETDAEKEALALQLFKEATGRFPQESSDRRSVYLGGFLLVGLVFLTTALVAMFLVLDDKEVPESLATLGTALGSGIVGGLFGYAKQG